MRQAFAILCATLFSCGAAHACWEAPTAACFTQTWTEEALAHHAEGPRVARLYDLINWDVVPPGEDVARTLLRDMRYADLVAHEATLQTHPDRPRSSGNPLRDMMFPQGIDEPSFDLAMMLMLGYFNAPKAGEIEEVPSDYLMAIRNIALESRDADLIREWTARLPDYLLNSPERADAIGTTTAVTPGAANRAHTIATLTALRDGDMAGALGAAEQATGAPGFLAWRAIARAAIFTGEPGLLERAIKGMQHGMDTQGPSDTSDQDFEEALARAEAEAESSGDPDAVTHLFEGLDTSADALPLGADLTLALARRYLNRLAGQESPDGFDAALDRIGKALRQRDEEDDDTLLRNARSALRLGMMPEAEVIIARAFADFPGVPDFQIHDLPEESTAWANMWLDLMMARYDIIARGPGDVAQRDYWDIWIQQDALTESIEITRALARYGRVAEARAFGSRAESYLERLSAAYPDMDLPALATIFRAEVAVSLLPPQEAAAALLALGESQLGIAFAFAHIGRHDLAMAQLAREEGLRNLPHWMQQLPQVPQAQRAGYIAALTALIDDEAAKLVTYPELVQDLYLQATLFHARAGNWPEAERAFGRIEDTESADGLLPAARSRMLALRELAQLLPDQVSMPVPYPWEDFAL